MKVFPVLVERANDAPQCVLSKVREDTHVIHTYIARQRERFVYIVYIYIQIIHTSDNSIYITRLNFKSR